MGATTTAAVSNFQTQFTNFMNYAGPIAQLLYLIVLMAAAVTAVVLFKRYVDFMTGKVVVKAEKKADDKAVSVDEFVD